MIVIGIAAPIPAKKPMRINWEMDSFLISIFLLSIVEDYHVVSEELASGFDSSDWLYFFFFGVLAGPTLRQEPIDGFAALAAIPFFCFRGFGF